MMSCSRLLMKIFLLLLCFKVISAVKCEYCNKDFISLGRHSWRCKARITSAVNDQRYSSYNANFSGNNASSNGLNNNKNQITTNTDTQILYVKCVCGKLCKGRRGLTAHQRSCKVFRDIGKAVNGIKKVDVYQAGSASHDHEECDPAGRTESAPSNNSNAPIPTLEKLPGIKLPKTSSEWSEANLYFTLQRDSLPPITDIDARTTSLQGLIYKYFAENYGTVNSNSMLNGSFLEKYKNLSCANLKKKLQKLKRHNCGNVHEIKWLSQHIRTLLKKNKTPIGFSDFTTEHKLKNNFWSTCKQLFNSVATRLPTFDLETCEDYFKRLLSAKCKTSFTFPNWFLKPKRPTFPFNDHPPTYQEISRAVSKSRASASPCPLDQMPTLVLKKCPILRTLIHEIYEECWIQKAIPTCWKRSFTILIYKKGDDYDPSNFRPITLQPIFYKLFSSIYRDRLFKYLKENDFIDDRVQKGFWPGCDGLNEHSTLLHHIMKDARLNQRSIVVTLLDLRNAFGEVSHSLIRSCLDYHHVPDTAIQLFSNIYKDSYVTVASSNDCTNPIKVDRGVLQGDPCSPLLFNICFNTLMETIKQESYSSLGYLWNTNTGQVHVNSWLQFADDAIIISNNDKNSQVLLNIFIAWCEWARMPIRVDKCLTFGMRKCNSVHDQYYPQLFINGDQLPGVEYHKDFKYLGSYYNWNLNLDQAKTDVLEKLNLFLSKVSMLKIRPQSKLKILRQVVYAKINFELKAFNFGHSWIKNELDSIVQRHVRQWLELPISTCLQEICNLPYEYGGLNIPSLQQVASQLHLTKRTGLKNSKQEDIRSVWKETSSSNVSTDEILLKTSTLKQAKKCLSEQELTESLSHLRGLNTQGSLLTSVVAVLKPSEIKRWSKSLTQLPATLFCFTRKAILNQLPTRSNLARWKLSNDRLCPACGTTQTNKHVLNNCGSRAALDRYKIRHDAVLLQICRWLQSAKPVMYELFADLPLYRSTSELFESFRPDIAVLAGTKIIVGELTICHETNMQKSKAFKTDKYKNLQSDVTTSYRHWTVESYTIEVSSLGLVSNLQQFVSSVVPQTITDSFLNDITKTVVGNSYTVYRDRNRFN